MRYLRTKQEVASLRYLTFQIECITFSYFHATHNSKEQLLPGSCYDGDCFCVISDWYSTTLCPKAQISCLNGCFQSKTMLKHAKPWKRRLASTSPYSRDCTRIINKPHQPDPSDLPVRLFRGMLVMTLPPPQSGRKLLCPFSCRLNCCRFVLFPSLCNVVC